MTQIKSCDYSRLIMKALQQANAFVIQFPDVDGSVRKRQYKPRRNNLTPDLLRNAVDGMVGRESRAFLPAHEMREVISGKIGPALRFVELDISGIALDMAVIGKGAEGVGNLAPTDVDRFRQ